MPTEPANAPSSERFSFRRLIRYSIGLQVFVIAVLLGATLWGALQTKEKSDDLARETKNVLLLTGVNQEFDRARVALRQYVRSGSGFSLGALSQSRQQISIISPVLEGGLPAGPRQTAAQLTEQQLDYLKDIGDKAVVLVRRGDMEGANAALTSPEAFAKLNEITGTNKNLSDALTGRQTSADQAVSRRQELNALLIVLSGLIILGTGIGVLLWIRSETMVPLENLAVASRKLGHGDLSARVEPGGVEEIALTGSAFNQMAEEIEQHVGQLHELSVARSRFVSSVSHELRTPITSLRGYLELLSQGEAGPLQPDQVRFVEVADRNARQLSDLIDDLLTLSRVQSGRMSLRAEGVNVRDLLHDLKTEMMPIGSERGVDVVLVDTGDLIVQGDAMRLRQAFGNLLSNSIKYSRDGQAVVVRALAVDRQAVISFVDWGMGIPREDLPQIAEPFFRSESSEGVPGTGLGLAIAKQMIELHGGRLAVESELGSGSTFTVYLPLDVLPAGAPDEEPPLAQSATTSGD
ncbi:MAG: HAMP domain-containing protein [Thermoleophilaceae bacterium]|nr:HAMP domain-containing protein [Thermoleophilaceae bacterium]